LLEASPNPPLTQESLQALVTNPALEASNVHWIRSFVSCDRARMIAELAAANPEIVEQACGQASIEFERVWVATIQCPVAAVTP
jgi:hypothetical protein